jgi:hypothetical protein
MTETTPGRARTYGGWREPRGWGLGTLTGAQSARVGGVLLVAFFMFPLGIGVGVLALGVAVVFIAATVVPFDNLTVSARITRGVRSIFARSTGSSTFISGALTRHERKHDLPGLLAPLVPLTTDDGRGGKQVLLWHRITGHLTAILRVSPIGISLADARDTDRWVASYGSWLADLGYKPMVSSVAVTVDTAPTGGTTVADYVTGRIDPTSAPLARQILGELVAATPTAASDVTTSVSVTFDPKKASPAPADLLAATAEVTRWLPGIESKLGSCGTSVLGRASTGWLIRRLRTAFDPAARGEASRGEAARTTTGQGRDGEATDVLRWEDGGPVVAEDDWDHYRHDTGFSVSWALDEAPRQEVTSRVLVPLMSPGVFPRRVTLLYRPFSAGDAAKLVEREIGGQSLRREWSKKTKRDETQRDRDDANRARQAAQEEAQGAGLGLFTVWVTTTVTDKAMLPAAIADVEERAGQSKLRLRQCRGAQAAGFAASLGVGIDPSVIARLR